MLSKFVGRIREHALPYVEVGRLGSSRLDREMTVLRVGAVGAGG